MSIQVADDRKIIVKVPLGTPTFVAENFIRKKKDWITKQLEKIEKQSELADSMGPLTDEDIRQIKKKAREVIPQRVEYYAKLAGISYKRIFIRLQKSRWGSCSVDGNLNFNCLLVLMPPEILDSVVVHELCHRRAVMQGIQNVKISLLFCRKVRIYAIINENFGGIICR